MSPRPNVSQTRKPQILQSAAQVFLRKGFTASRMEDIAKQTGLSVGNLYRYFSGKLDLTLALIRLYLEPGLQDSNHLLDASGSVRERLEASILSVLSKQDSAMLTLYAEMYHLARQEAGVHALLTDYNSQYRQIVARLVQQGIERGELRACDPISVAFTLQALFDGYMQNLHLAPTNFDLNTALHQSFDMLFEGLNAPPASDSGLS